MTNDTKQKTAITTWIIYSGEPATESWRLHGAGKSEAAAMRDAIGKGDVPAGAKAAKLVEPVQ